MTIALNIVMGSIVLVGIVTLLARSIKADADANASKTTTSPVQPATVRGARIREHRTTSSRDTAGVH